MFNCRMIIPITRTITMITGGSKLRVQCPGHGSDPSNVQKPLGCCRSWTLTRRLTIPCMCNGCQTTSAYAGPFRAPITWARRSIPNSESLVSDACEHFSMCLQLRVPRVATLLDLLTSCWVKAMRAYAVESHWRRFKKTGWFATMFEICSVGYAAGLCGTWCL